MLMMTGSDTLCDGTTTGGQAKELDMQDGMHMDIGQEVGRLKRTLHDARRRIMFRAEVATVKNCRKLVSGWFCSVGWWWWGTGAHPIIATACHPTPHS